MSLVQHPNQFIFFPRWSTRELTQGNLSPWLCPQPNRLELVPPPNPAGSQEVAPSKNSVQRLFSQGRQFANLPLLLQPNQAGTALEKSRYQSWTSRRASTRPASPVEATSSPHMPQPPAEMELVRRRWLSKPMATPHALNKPSGQPQLPHKPSSLAVQPGQAVPCFHLPELLLEGYTQGYGEARAECVPAHPGALAIGLSMSKESCQGEGHCLLQLQAWPEASGSPELPRKGGKPEQQDMGDSQTSPPAEVTGTAGS